MPTTPGAPHSSGSPEETGADTRLRRELRASLSVVRNVLDIIAAHHRDLPSPLRDAVPRAIDEADVMARMIEDAEVTEGPLRIHREPLDLAAFAERVVAERRRTTLRHHRCKVDVPARPVLVHGDRVRLEQVLTNLLHNAATYSPPQRTIVVSVQDTDGAVELAVTDQGSGVAPADIEKVFTPYQRLRPDQRRRGLGLGLPAARAVVRAHGGELECRPAPDGPGARFVVCLPRPPGAPQGGAGRSRGRDLRS